MSEYDDIINLPHHQSFKRPRMSIKNRAAQFAPFSALKGYDSLIEETDRPTQARFVLDELELNNLDNMLQYISDNINDKINVEIKYFIQDKTKNGGSYSTFSGIVKNIDLIEMKIIFVDGTSINLLDIYSIKKIK